MDRSYQFAWGPVGPKPGESWTNLDRSCPCVCRSSYSAQGFPRPPHQPALRHCALLTSGLAARQTCSSCLWVCVQSHPTSRLWKGPGDQGCRGQGPCTQGLRWGRETVRERELEPGVSLHCQLGRSTPMSLRGGFPAQGLSGEDQERHSSQRNSLGRGSGARECVMCSGIDQLILVCLGISWF